MALDVTLLGVQGQTPAEVTALAGRHDLTHNKVVVADDAAVTGSSNLSNSVTENAENVIVIEGRDVADRPSACIDRVARRYRPA